MITNHFWLCYIAKRRIKTNSENETEKKKRLSRNSKRMTSWTVSSVLHRSQKLLHNPELWTFSQASPSGQFTLARAPELGTDIGDYRKLVSTVDYCNQSRSQERSSNKMENLDHKSEEAWAVSNVPTVIRGLPGEKLRRNTNICWFIGELCKNKTDYNFEFQNAPPSSAAWQVSR